MISSFAPTIEIISTVVTSFWVAWFARIFPFGTSQILFTYVSEQFEFKDWRNEPKTGKLASLKYLSIFFIVRY